MSSNLRRLSLIYTNYNNIRAIPYDLKPPTKHSAVKASCYYECQNRCDASKVIISYLKENTVINLYEKIVAFIFYAPYAYRRERSSLPFKMVEMVQFRYLIYDLARNVESCVRICCRVFCTVGKLVNQNFRHNSKLKF